MSPTTTANFRFTAILSLCLLISTVSWADEPMGSGTDVVYETDVYTGDMARFLDLVLSSDDLDLVREEADYLSDSDKDLICLVAQQERFPLATLNERLAQIGWTGPYLEAAPLTKAEPITSPMPSYTSEAREQRIQGTVAVTAVIGEDGLPRTLIVTESDPMLAPPAVRAIQTSTFRPAELDGQAVASCYSKTANFQLQ
jgi:TonB family protein